MNYCSFFKNKKITLMGLGLLGRGVGDVAFLAECGADLIVTDLKSKKELKESLKKLQKYKNITFVLGRHRYEDFSASSSAFGGKGPDMIIKAAGVPLDSPYIKEAKKSGVPVEMSTSLFVKLLPKGVTVLGITGTKGKSTVAHLLFQIIKRHFDLNRRANSAAVGRTTRQRRVVLGGNIKGVSTLALLKKIHKGDVVVLELDSWQLQGFGESAISPHIAVFTNFMPDHLNYYKGSMKRYFLDKANIFLHQKKGDMFVASLQAMNSIKKFGLYRNIRSKKMEVPGGVPAGWSTLLLGSHNRENICIAIAAARALRVPEKVLKRAIANFGGVPGRLEFLTEYKGVRFYNDTNATTPDATIAALHALQPTTNNPQSTTILIMGGADKGLPTSRLAKEIPKYCKAVVLLPGTGTSKLISNFQFLLRQAQDGEQRRAIISNQPSIFTVKNLKEAVDIAIKEAQRSDTIVLSPAFASFGLFKNEFDRGQQFDDIIKNL